MIDGKHSYVYTREGDCHQLSDLIDNIKNEDYVVNCLVEDKNVYQRILTVDRDESETDYYKVITDSGKYLVMADNDKIAVRIDNPNGPDKEKRFVTVKLMQQMLQNNEPINVYISDNNFSAEMNESINKRIGSFYDGLVLALLFAPDSKFYLNNPGESYIEIKFLNNFEPKNVKRWINDLTYSKYLEYLFGSNFILNCKSKTDRNLVPNHEVKIDKYKYEDVLDNFKEHLFGPLGLIWDDSSKDEIRGFSSIFDKSIKTLDDLITRFILTKTTYQFKSGFFQTLAQIYTTNMFEKDWKHNEFRTKDLYLLEIMKNCNYLYSSPYVVEEIDDYFNFKITNQRCKYTKVKEIIPYKAEIPVSLMVFKQNFICNEFEFLIL